MEPDDPIRRVLDHIDDAIRWTELRRDILEEVRDLIRGALGEQTGGSSPRDRA